MKRFIFLVPILLVLFALGSPVAADVVSPPTDMQRLKVDYFCNDQVQCIGIDISLQPDSQTLASGSVANFQITLKNTGNVDIHVLRVLVDVTDLQASCQKEFTFSSFPPGSSFSYPCSTASSVSTDFVATATAYATRSAEPFVNDWVEDSDSSEVKVANAAIAIKKYVEFPASGGDLCATFGKPKILTMTYTGGNSQSHSQDSGKVTVNDVGPLNMTSQVFIRATDKDNPDDLSGHIWFEGTVDLGENFIIDATAAGQTRLPADTRVHIFKSTDHTQLLQSVKFHTSCSQPLELGNQFGGIQLAGFQDENDATAQSAPRDDADMAPGPSATVGDAVVWTYDVKNTGDVTLTEVTVTDDQGVTVTCPKTTLAVGETMTCSASGTVVAGQYTNVGEATGKDPDGQSVPPATDPAHYFGVLPVVDQCADGAKPQVLTMTYTGGNTQSNSQDSGKVTVNEPDPSMPLDMTPQVFIRATDKDNPDDLGGHIWFSGTVNLGENFVIDATAAGQTRLPADTRVHIFGPNPGDPTLFDQLLQSVKFHTSCSQPLFIGDQFGGIQLAGFTAE